MKAKELTITDKNGVMQAPSTLSRFVYHNSEKLSDMVDANNLTLKNKILVFIGDSITARGEFTSALKNLTGCLIVNKGVSATMMAKKNADDNNSFITRVDSISTQVDAVFVFGGTNDWTSGASPFGEFSDGYNESKYTFCSGVHCLFKALHDKFTPLGIPVVIITPTHHGPFQRKEFDIKEDGTVDELTNHTGKTFYDYCEMIKKIAWFYSFDVIDACAESNLNPYLDNEMYADTLHFNSAGGLRFAKFLIPHIKRILSEY